MRIISNDWVSEDLLYLLKHQGSVLRTSAMKLPQDAPTVWFLRDGRNLDSDKDMVC